MQAWQQDRERRLVGARLRRREDEVKELSVRPQQQTKAVNEQMLRGTSYVGPISGWKQHASHFHDRRNPGERNQNSARRVSAQKASAIFERLYPYSPAKFASASTLQQTASLNSGRARSATATNCSKYELTPRTAAAMSHSKDDFSSDEKLISMQVTAAKESSAEAVEEADSEEYNVCHVWDWKLVTGTGSRRPASADCSRRLGRPNKTTWQYLFERGTEQQRSRNSSAPREPSCERLRPVPHSEALLRLAHRERPPLWRPRPRTPSPNRPRSSSPSMTSRAMPTGIEDPRLELFHARNDRQQDLHARRMEVAAELKRVKEMRECTFRPKVNANHDHGNCNPGANKASASWALSRNLSLYNRGLEAKAYRRQRDEAAAKELAEAELRECTFQPHTGRRSTPRRTSRNEARCATSATTAACVAVAKEPWDLQSSHRLAVPIHQIHLSAATVSAATESTNRRQLWSEATWSEDHATPVRVALTEFASPPQPQTDDSGSAACQDFKDMYSLSEPSHENSMMLLEKMLTKMVPAISSSGSLHQSDAVEMPVGSSYGSLDPSRPAAAEASCTTSLSALSTRPHQSRLVELESVVQGMLDETRPHQSRLVALESVVQGMLDEHGL